MVHPVGEQQPAQLVGPQTELTQTPPPPAPAAQLSPVPQVPQALPNAPQAASLVPATHSLPAQHPAHSPQSDCATHTPVASQVSPAGQVQDGWAATQVPPVPPSRLASHAAGMDAFEQSKHNAPPAPQAERSVPAWHFPSAQHPSGHVASLQGGPASAGMYVIPSPTSDDRPQPAMATTRNAARQKSARRAKHEARSTMSKKPLGPIIVKRGTSPRTLATNPTPRASPRGPPFPARRDARPRR